MYRELRNIVRPVRRRGIFSIELALTLPILGVILMGLFQFSMLFYSRGTVVDAARAGARLATQPGVSRDAVEEEVVRTLEPRMRSAADVQMRIGEHAGDEVIVAVRVPMSRCAPNLLWPIGITLADRQMQAQTRMVRE